MSLSGFGVRGDAGLVAGGGSASYTCLLVKGWCRFLEGLVKFIRGWAFLCGEFKMTHSISFLLQIYSDFLSLLQSVSGICVFAGIGPFPAGSVDRRLHVAFLLSLFLP